jgi:hypothetical protein
MAEDMERRMLEIERLKKFTKVTKFQELQV